MITEEAIVTMPIETLKDDFAALMGAIVEQYGDDQDQSASTREEEQQNESTP